MLTLPEVRDNLTDLMSQMDVPLPVTVILDALYVEYLAKVDYLEKQGLNTTKNYRIKKKLMKKLSKWSAKTRIIELDG